MCILVYFIIINKLYDVDIGEVDLKKYLMGIFGFIILFAADYISKSAAVNNLKGTEGIPVIKGVFSLSYLENHGAAFGMLQNRRMLLLIMTAVILIALIIFFIKLPNTRKYMPLSIITVVIAAGAIGNMYDRIVNGYVIDFLYFELIDFPVFNLADCYVVISAILSLILVIFYYGEDDFDFLMKKK